MKRLGIILGVLLALGGSTAHAQYFTNGQEPFSTRWREYRDERYRLIYPERTVREARRVAAVLDAAYGDLHYGFSRPAIPLPIILHAQNLRSNGVVVWTPRRAELITAPPTDTYAVPWLKQLAVHEYRHVVQMSNLSRGVIRAARWLLGEQALGASAAFVPKWFLEGDAVLAETAMATRGRALQPEFTLAYRALLAGGGVDQFSIDKWFIGSYRDFLPDHYHYGYQMVNLSYQKFGTGMWERVFDYVARRPWQILPRQIAMKRFYGTHSAALFREAFGALKTRWDALPPVTETMRIVPTPTDSYTTYSHPIATPAGTILAHKSDYTRGDRLVSVDPRTGAERLLARTGPLSSRPTLAGDELYWTEYRPSSFWEQRNRSVVRHMPADGGRRARTRRWDGNLFYVTPRAGGFAAVAYDAAAKYAVVLFDAGFRELRRVQIPDGLSVHGLAWDEASNTLALITLGERGMALSGVRTQTGELYAITAPSHTAINHLRGGGGRLYFNSTASGRDESHGYDLTTGREYRLSASRFASVMPAPDASGRRLVQASYRRDGYRISIQELDGTVQQEILSGAVPVDAFNLPMVDLGVKNLDTKALYPAADARPWSSRRYRRTAHGFTLHSWAPVSIDPFEAVNDRNLDLAVGATILTQNELSDTEGFLSYGRAGGFNWWRGKLRLLAMAPKFEIGAEYGGGRRGVVLPNDDTPAPAGWDKDYFSVEGRAWLPVNLSSGAALRSLSPSLSLTHYNTMLYIPENEDFRNGYQQAEASLSYAQNSRMALRDLAPRWGFGVQGTWASAPFVEGFGSLWSLYGNVYVPGAANNHSLRLRGAWQTQSRATYHFSSNVLFPRGVPYDFAPRELASAAADYRLPIAYPDWGIDQVIYIKRLSANLFGGYARYAPVNDAPWRTAWSYGAELTVDFNPLRMIGAGFSVRAALYRSSVSDPVDFSLGLSFSL